MVAAWSAMHQDVCIPPPSPPISYLYMLQKPIHRIHSHAPPRQIHGISMLWAHVDVHDMFRKAVTVLNNEKRCLQVHSTDYKCIYYTQKHRDG